ncbi:uncharacterized protein RCC_10820 [Ramularia collo-cygni]|uniref:Chromo domain-containing protein n=1 Tax=Ramularia collo-cygni TaxID=112498 RepID=A0A2D3VKM0_9PEZI|nr:uncharacterized protein RCC_10820 [Ramularia collo-cygni]CZT25091.1 uncharacterized protein RCC_10820 [Ramularia collo-cygni]
MVGQSQITDVSVTEILQFVSPYDLEEFENGQFLEEEENRKIAQAAEEAAEEARRLRKLEKIRKKGIVYFEERNEDLESNEEGEVVLGRHGRARPTYSHLYKVPGGGEDGGKRRRRRRDPSTGDLMPLSDEENLHTMGSSDEGVDLNRSSGRSGVRQAPALTSGLQPPKRRRRKRHPITNELMPLSGDENAGSSDGGPILQSRTSSSVPIQAAGPSYAQTAEPSMRSNSIFEDSGKPTSAPMQQATIVPSPARRMLPNVTVELPKRRRRRRDPITGELLPLDPDPQDVAVSENLSSSRFSNTEERQKRPRRRRHPITGELMPLGWVYNPNAGAESFESTANGSSMQSLSITRDSKRVKLASEPSSSSLEDPRPAVAPTSAASPNVRQPNVIELSESDQEEQDDSSSMQLSIDSAPASKPTTQVRSPKHGMMQRARSYSSSNEPITLQSFLSTTATGKAGRDDDETSEDTTSGEETALKKTPSQKTSIMNPTASQEIADDEDDDQDIDDELDEGEYFVEAIQAHHMSDPRTHPGKERVMLYHTKWEGWDEMTWEPAASFPDQSVVEEYRRRAGLKP